MSLVKGLLGPGGVVPHGLKTTALERLVIWERTSNWFRDPHRVGLSAQVCPTLRLRVSATVCAFPKLLYISILERKKVGLRCSSVGQGLAWHSQEQGMEGLSRGKP